jgi:hypothetical protein
VTTEQILDADRFGEIVGPQARAFGDDETTAAIKAAVEEAETLAAFSAAGLDDAPPWLADPVARIALFLLSQTAEGWNDAQLAAAATQYRRAVTVLTARRGQVAPVTSVAGAVVGPITDLPTW